MKTISRKALSLILTLAMLFGMVQTVGVTAFAASAATVKIAGIDLNRSTPYWNSGETTATKDSQGSYNAYFDSTTGTLYLKNATISNSSGNGIEAGGDLVINCEGTNTVTGSIDGINTCSALTVEGSGDLSVTGTEHYGILTQGTLAANNGSLSVEGKLYGIYANNHSGNQVNIDTTNDVSVTSSDGTGIFAQYGNISVTSESGKVTIAAGSTSSAVMPYYGTATVSGYNGVTITAGQYGITNDRSSSDVSVASKNGSVSVAGSCGVIASKSGVSISSAKDVTLAGTSGLGVSAKAAVSVTAGGNISITGNGNFGVNAFNAGDVTLDAGGALHVKANEAGINCQNGTVKLSGTIPKEDTLTITNNTIVPEGKTLVNNGTITLSDGKTFTVQGTLVNNGTIPGKTVPKWTSVLSDNLTWSDHIVKDGTTYTVKSAQGLAWIAGVTNGVVTADTYQNDPDLPGDSSFDGCSVVLANDIDLSGNQWVPIGNCDDAELEFKGIFNGDAHVISGMAASGFRFSGLFGEIGEHGTVKNFTISGTANSEHNDSYGPSVGGVSGYNSGVISNVISHVAVSAYGNGICAGVIAGGNGGTIQNCISTGTVSGENLGSMAGVGGICGSNRAVSALVQNCYSMSNVSGIGNSVDIGGLVGWNYSYEQGTVKNSYWHNDGKLTNGVGDIKYAQSYPNSTVTSIGSFSSGDVALIATDGTTLNYTGTLLSVLNTWVGAQSDSTLKNWAVNSAVNSGYPVFGGKITYVLGDGNWADGYTVPAAYAEGVPTTLPTAANVTRSGYTFSGWTKTESASDTDYLTDISAKSSGNVTVYAKWSVIPPKSSSNSIVSFAIGSSIGTINETNHAVAVTVPYGASLTSLTPAITLSKNATVSPASGMAQDFSKPVTYTVTAEDGSKQNYVVMVTVGAASHNGGGSNNHSNGSDTSTSAIPSTISTTTNAAGGTVATVTTVSDSAPTISGNQAAISVTVPADVTSVITSATAEKPAQVQIAVPTASVVEQLQNSAVQTVDLTVTVPAAVANNTNANATVTINAAQEVLQAAKDAKKDVTVSVVNAATGNEAYSWTFKGSDLASSTAAVKSVDLALSVKTTAEVSAVNAATPNNKGLVLNFASSNGVLPSNATIKINVADKGYKAGQTLYFYYYNPTTKQLEQVGDSAVYTVDADGYVSVTITHCSDYVLLPKAVRSLALDTTSYTIAPKGSYQIGSKLMGADGTTLKVYSTNSGIAAVVKLANGNYQVTGKGTGTAYIMYDVYDKKNKKLTHASVRINVAKGTKPFGSSARQTGIF